MILRVRIFVGSLIGFISQAATSAINKILFRYFLHLKVIHGERLKNLKGPLIIVANHISRSDPFFIGAALPFWSRVFPIRFAIAPEYYYNPFLFPFLWLLAGFPIRQGIGLENSLKTPLTLLRRGQVVGWFPEGKIRRVGEQTKAKRGIGYLALATNTPIVPIKIENSSKLTVWKFFTRAVWTTIHIGEAFIIPQEIKASGNVNAIAEFIMEKVWKTV